MQRRASAGVLLFTGLLRHPEMFERQLELAHGLEGLDRRIFATWTDDYAKNETVLKRLQQRFGLDVVHGPQPPFVTGHYLHQMLALDTGLRQVGDDDVVLKTRTDIVIEPAAIAYVLRKPRRIACDGLHRDLYVDHVIDVTEAQISAPFIYDDIAFCGVAADLRRFVNMEMMFQVAYRGCSYVHERYFGTLFSSRVAFLKDYYRDSWAMGGDDGLPWARVIGNDYRRRMIAFAMRDRDFGVMMALSYLVTSQMFSFDWGRRTDFLSFHGAQYACPAKGPRWGGQGFEHQTSLGGVFADPAHYAPLDASIATNADAFMARIVAGDFEPCAIGRNIRDGLASVQAASLRDLQSLADMKGFTARAAAHSKQVVHDLLPQFRTHAHALAGAGKVSDAELLINRLITHMAA